MRIFKELSPSRDRIAQMYCAGLEKKEIADKLNRSIITVKNTLQKVYTQLGVNNGRELTLKLAERITGVEILEILKQNFK